VNHLIARYGYNIKKFEKIPVTTSNPMLKGKLPFQIEIADDRDASAKEAEEVKEKVQVFTDGSAINGKVGIAAILIRAGKPIHKLHMHLGPEKEHMVHKAELVGMLLGMHLISTEKCRGTTCVMGINNQAAIRAFHMNQRGPGHHIAREIQQLTSQTHKKWSKVKYDLTIRWMAGYKGIEGNEEADREAKKAAKGTSSDRKLLPAYLRKRAQSHTYRQEHSLKEIPVHNQSKQAEPQSSKPNHSVQTLAHAS
jgi:ribonuclease HI